MVKFLIPFCQRWEQEWLYGLDPPGKISPNQVLLRPSSAAAVYPPRRWAAVQAARFYDTLRELHATHSRMCRAMNLALEEAIQWGEMKGFVDQLESSFNQALLCCTATLIFL